MESLKRVDLCKDAYGEWGMENGEWSGRKLFRRISFSCQNRRRLTSQTLSVKGRLNRITVTSLAKIIKELHCHLQPIDKVQRPGREVFFSFLISFFFLEI